MISLDRNYREVINLLFVLPILFHLNTLIKPRKCYNVGIKNSRRESAREVNTFFILSDDEARSKVSNQIVKRRSRISCSSPFMASSDLWTRFVLSIDETAVGRVGSNTRNPEGHPGSIGYFMGILCGRREILESTATWKLRIRNEFFARIDGRVASDLIPAGILSAKRYESLFPQPPDPTVPPSPPSPPPSSPLPLDFLIYRRRIYRFCFLSFKVADHLLISLLRQVFRTRSST